MSLADEILLKSIDIVSRPFVRRAIQKRHLLREIASNVLITEKWIEIEPDPPMMLSKLCHSVRLTIADYKFEFDVHGDDDRIVLLDGSIVSPEVEIEDEFGNRYELENSSRFGSDVAMRPQNGFLPDRSYKTLRIRSGFIRSLIEGACLVPASSGASPPQ